MSRGEKQYLYTVCQLGEGSGWSKNKEANAALIAAAPEMYDVLQHYFDLLEQANNGDAVAECKLFEDIVLIE